MVSVLADTPGTVTPGIANPFITPSSVTLEFAKAKTNVIPIFELIACYSYSGYSNL